MTKLTANEVLEVIPEAVDAAGSDLLSRVEKQTEQSAAGRVRTQSGVVIGTYRGRNDAGEPLVELPRSAGVTAVAARSAVALAAADIGRDVVLAFDGGEADRPIVIGLVQPAEPVEPRISTRDIRIDGERVTFEAGQEVVIRCGEASITLTRAGKVLIRGKYILTRSSGANRIKGASIEMN